LSVCFILQVQVKEGHEEAFLDRYDALQKRIAEGLEGHRVHRLAQDVDDSRRWLIESHWEDAESARDWEQSDEHRALTMPLRECWDEARRTAYTVRVETRHP
jgi:heme-degrading monooxygenase HmoA